jgi:hypothetical protein
MDARVKPGHDVDGLSQHIDVWVCGIVLAARFAPELFGRCALEKVRGRAVFEACSA